MARSSVNLTQGNLDLSVDFKGKLAQEEIQLRAQRQSEVVEAGKARIRTTVAETSCCLCCFLQFGTRGT